MNYKNIPELETMTAQEVFDKALQHVYATKKKSGSNERCMYSGIGCAASPFLIKEYRKHASNRKNSAWVDLVQTNTVIDKHIILISRIQGAHDYAGMESEKDFMDDFVYDMKEIANEFELNFTPPSC